MGIYHNQLKYTQIILLAQKPGIFKKLIYS